MTREATPTPYCWGQAFYGTISTFRQHKMQQLLAGLAENERSIFRSLFEKAIDAAEIYVDPPSSDEPSVHSYAQEDRV